MGFGRVFSYDIGERFSAYVDRNKGSLIQFFILFAITIAIFGQKLFFYSLPSDDYMRFWGDDNTKMLITNSARWAQALLNDYVFAGKLQILPYLHGIVGIFCFTMMGYLSAKFLERREGLEVALVTLLIAATPMFAHNLYFSTNITTWLSLLLGLMGFFALYRPGFLPKITGFLLLLFSIANYQSIIQIVILLVIFRFILTLLRMEKSGALKALIWRSIFVIGVTSLAYVASCCINQLFLDHYHLQEVHRLKQAGSSLHLAALIAHLKTVYTTPVVFQFFNKPLHVLYMLLTVTAIGGTLAAVYSKKDETLLIKTGTVVLILAAFAMIPLVVNLPLLLGVDIPLRAYFPLGWAVAGLFVLTMETTKGLFRSLGLIAASMIVIVSAYYITRFFDGCMRQTEADIRRANMIVQRIRMDKNYSNEPIGFRIEGQKKFNVKGWSMQWQQPFNSFWAKYKIFTYFTDLHFHTMSKKDLQEISDYLIQRGEPVTSYPGKNSIVVYHNNAILFLNPDKMNIQIKKMQDVKKIPLDRAPDVHAKFNLYVKDGTLFYYKQACSSADISRKFFLRIYPKDPENTVINGRKGGAFQTWDFKFDLYGVRKDGSCIAAVELPTSYDIAKIRTGQFKKEGLDWDVTYQISNE